MPTNSKLLVISGLLLGAGLIGGCATGASTSGSTMNSGMGGMGAGHKDMQTMCEKHKGMMAGKSPAEQQAMMDEHMKSMSPEMQTRMKTMNEQCKTT